MTPAYAIPFNRPEFVGREAQYMNQALAEGHISGDGQFSAKCHAFLEAELGVAKALLTTSCTHALEMAALMLDLDSDAEIVLPTFTFVSCANAFALRGAKLVFADSRPDTLNLDERLLPDLVTPQTKAIVTMHYGGVGCEMDSIQRTAAGVGAAIIEDNAHGLFGRYRGCNLGTFGRFATLSFHETKNFTCGEGGALLMNDPADVERAEILREKGTNRSRFFRGLTDKYTWVDVGSSSLPSELLAAVFWGQLEHHEMVQARRLAIWEAYRLGLSDWAAEEGVDLPLVPDHCQHTSHIFHLLLPSESSRQRLIAHLGERGILGVFHYLPLHLSPMGRKRGGQIGQCPVAEDISSRLIRLPLYYGLGADEQDRVISAIRDFQP